MDLLHAEVSFNGATVRALVNTRSRHSYARASLLPERSATVVTDFAGILGQRVFFDAELHGVVLTMGNVVKSIDVRKPSASAELSIFGDSDVDVILGADAFIGSILSWDRASGTCVLEEV